MIITGRYSHKGGEEFINKNHSRELLEVEKAINGIDATTVFSKKNGDSQRKFDTLYSPIEMNEQISKTLSDFNWTKHPRINFEGRQYREMDAIKNKVGLEIQFGKYSFMSYDIFSKMPIFANHGLIECGIEVVVMSSMAKKMSNGVSSFSHIKTDMKERGVADIDIPTLILGFEMNVSTLIEWGI